MTQQAGSGGGSQVLDRPAHPVADFTDRLGTRLAALTDPATAVPLSALSSSEKQRVLRSLATAQTQLEALRLAVLVEAGRDEQVLDPGDRTVADWAARQTRQTRAAARADLRLAGQLETDYPTLGAAVARAAVRVDQARAIVRGLDLLPRSGDFAVTTEQVTTAEAHLVDLAAVHDAKDLEHLARRVYEVICPEHADAYEGRLLEAEESRAARKTTFEIRTDHQGIAHGRFQIPQLHGEMLNKALQAILNPARTSNATNEGCDAEPVERDPRPLVVRRGLAFCELLERTCARDLPTTGGGDATVIVTMTLEDLLGRLQDAGVATLDTGTRISAAEARRLACRHRVIPMVLGGESIVLDQGRAKRLHPKDQRLALHVQQQHCTTEHCDVPASMCHVHHDLAWAHGGGTDTHTGRLVCGPHHRRIHDPTYEHHITPEGKVRFHRRT